MFCRPRSETALKIASKSHVGLKAFWVFSHSTVHFFSQQFFFALILSFNFILGYLSLEGVTDTLCNRGQDQAPSPPSPPCPCRQIWYPFSTFLKVILNLISPSRFYFLLWKLVQSYLLFLSFVPFFFFLKISVSQLESFPTLAHWYTLTQIERIVT